MDYYFKVFFNSQDPRVVPKICFFLYLSQGSYGGYVYTYAVKSPLRMTSAQGAFLTSVFWVSRNETNLEHNVSVS